MKIDKQTCGQMAVISKSQSKWDSDAIPNLLQKEEENWFPVIDEPENFGRKTLNWIKVNANHKIQVELSADWLVLSMADKTLLPSRIVGEDGEDAEFFDLSLLSMTKEEFDACFDLKKGVDDDE